MNDISTEMQATMDTALQEQFPMHIVGVYTPFVPLATAGLRCLMTANGLMLEACNGVYYFRDYLTRMCAQIKMPYGELEPDTHVVDAQAHADVTRFMMLARREAHASASTEIVRLIVKAPGMPVRCFNPVQSASSQHAHYDMSQLVNGEQVIIDLHSHGVSPSYFSHTDNSDDRIFRGNLKLAVVLGNCDRQPTQMSAIARYVARGVIFESQSVPT